MEARQDANVEWRPVHALFCVQDHGFKKAPNHYAPVPFAALLSTGPRLHDPPVACAGATHDPRVSLLVHCRIRVPANILRNLIPGIKCGERGAEKSVEWVVTKLEQTREVVKHRNLEIRIADQSLKEQHKK